MSESLIGGHYRVIDCLRKTRFSETYKAEDTHLLPPDNLCVIKKLQPQSNEAFVLETAQRLFQNEGQALGNLGIHPQIPRLLAYFVENQNFYLVQEYIQGQDLSQEISPGDRLDVKKVVTLLQEVLNILKFVHGKGVIHRDIKPSNLIRRQSPDPNLNERIVLIDFGAVKELTNPTIVASHDAKVQDLTVAVGTYGYMPPEQQMGRPRPNSDIYALGMTAVQALTGVHPNDIPRDKNTDEVVWRDRVPESSLTNRNDKNKFRVLADIIDRMIARDFTERYKTADEILKVIKDKMPDTVIDLESSDSIFPQPIPRKKSIPAWKLILGAVSFVIFGGAALIVPRVLKAYEAIQLNEQGIQLIGASKYKEAVDAFDKAIQIQPRYADALTNRGFALGKMQRYLEKFSSCDKATQIDPKSAEAWNCKGLARFELKQYDLSIGEYESAINADPTFFRAWFNKGQALLELKKYQESLLASREVLFIDDEYFLAWTQTCRALYELQRYEEAKLNCEKSLKLNPDYKPTKQLLERIQSKLDKK
jgi:eukaryotic-like serine/threonine-protein kinase